MARKTITNRTDLSKLSAADLSAAINLDTDPTRGQFLAYTAAYDYFNRRLWDGKLPRCILNFSRKSKYMGFFAPESWKREKNVTHEISLNPDVLERDPRETMSTLVHEMAHLWQQENGQPSRNGYHNGEWAAEMNRVGLKPVNNNDPEKQTGQSMTHEIVEDGPFAAAFESMPREHLLPWLSGAAQREKKPKSKNQDKVKYACPRCDVVVWGKADLAVLCGVCTLAAIEAEEPELVVMAQEVKEGD